MLTIFLSAMLVVVIIVGWQHGSVRRPYGDWTAALLAAVALLTLLAWFLERRTS